ncbi:MAG: molybdopterin-dependent oxidoreductase [Azonexus sp.]|jgi:isoquinoline 1-oxidoreductase beta subunit|nr:molybdopterin-dependent oxidoreductase [Azonexus sp.]
MTSASIVKFAESDADVRALMQAVREQAAGDSLAIDRRSFLKLAGLGLILGFCLPTSAGSRGKGRGGEKTLAFNAFVQVAPDNTVTVFSKAPEIGQGIKTALGLIIAEEMDADWQRVVVEQAPVDGKIYGYQGAGGSTTIPRAWDQLRQAGAAAKAMLVAAAAQTWRVDPAAITARDSRLTHAASQRSATYGEMAMAAAQMPLPDVAALQLKTRGQYRLLGRAHRGVDDPKLVSGQPLFGIDVRLPGMVYATFAKCPAAGGKVKSANLDVIRAQPNVLDAFVIEGNGKPSELMSGVAIIARNTWAAWQARKLLQVEWDESAASTDSSVRFAARAKEYARTFPARLDADVGNVDQAFAGAGKIVEAFYEYPFAAHATMEPQNATAWWHDGIMEMWVPTQQPNSGQALTARLLGLAEDKVIVHQTRVGGGFGRRLLNDYMAEAAAIARRVKYPVKLQWSREDDFAHDFLRPAGWHQFKGAVDKQGRLDAWQEHFITFTANGKTPSSGADYSRFLALYCKAPHLRRAVTMMDLRTPSGPWRAPGCCAQVFAQQGFMHELAVAAGRDHVEFLIEAVNRDVPELASRDATVNFSPARAAGVIKLCAEKAGWGKTLPKGRGLGLAWCYSHAGHAAQAVELSVDADKRITLHRVVVAVDIGQVIDLAGAESQAQGACLDGFSTALGLQAQIDGGRVQTRNFDAYPLLRFPFAPAVIDTYFVQSEAPPVGMGEPALPAMAPAVANAIFAATGERLRKMPFSHAGYRV